MRSNSCSSRDAAGEPAGGEAPTLADGAMAGGAPTLADGAQLLGAVRAAAVAAHDAVVGLVDAVHAAARSGTVMALEGLSLDLVLALDHHMTGADRAMLLRAAQVLPSLPATWRLFRQRTLSWSQVRDIVTQAARLTVDQRGQLDTRIAASLDLVDKLDPDRLRWAVSDAVDELRGATAKQRREAAQARDVFACAQLDFDGAGRLYAGAGPVDMAVLLNAIAAYTDPPTTDTSRARQPSTRARQLGRGLIRIAAAALGVDPDDLTPPAHRTDSDDTAGDTADTADTADVAGGDTGAAADAAVKAAVARARARGDHHGGHRRLAAKPLFVCHVDIHDFTPTAAGLLELPLPGAMPTLSAALVESLVRSRADVRAVLFDGKRPLAVTRKVAAADIPPDTRLAVGARDLGSRFPADRLPVAMTEIHHLHGRAHGHHPDTLITVSRKTGHHAIHKRGWTVTLDPHTGAATWTRGNRSHTTLPWNTRLRRPPPHNQPGDPHPHHAGAQTTPRPTRDANAPPPTPPAQTPPPSHNPLPF